MKRWRKGPPRALRAPRVAPERPCWPRQPQSSPSGAGACVPRLSPSLLMAALGGGVPTALQPRVWTSRDQLRWNSLGLPGQLKEERRVFKEPGSLGNSWFEATGKVGGVFTDRKVAHVGFS